MGLCLRHLGPPYLPPRRCRRLFACCAVPSTPIPLKYALGELSEGSPRRPTFVEARCKMLERYAFERGTVAWMWSRSLLGSVVWDPFCRRIWPFCLTLRYTAALDGLVSGRSNDAAKLSTVAVKTWPSRSYTRTAQSRAPLLSSPQTTHPTRRSTAPCTLLFLLTTYSVPVPPPSPTQSRAELWSDPPQALIKLAL
jgi:hypothetical protein